MRAGIASTLLAIGLLGQQAVATGKDWTKAEGHSVPDTCNNECSEKQSKAYTFEDAQLGQISVYDQVSLSGFQVQDGFQTGKGRFAKRTGGKCIAGKVTEDHKESPKITHNNDKGMSIVKLHVSVDIEVNIKFLYDMPDGKQCSHTSKCSPGGSKEVKNDQCGGAKSVKMHLPPKKEGGKQSCNVGIHKVEFDCKPPVKTPPKTSSTTKKEDKPKTTSSSSSKKEDKPKTTSSSSSKKEDKPKTTSSSSSKKEDKHTTTSTSSSKKEDKHTTTSTSSSKKEDKHTTTAPSTTTTSSEYKNSTTPAHSSSKEEKPSSSKPASPETTTSSSSKKEEEKHSSSTPSSPEEKTSSESKPAESSPSSTPSPTPSTTSYTTSTIYTTTEITVTSCAPTIKDCPASGAVVTSTIAVSTTVCPVTDAPAPSAPPADSPAPPAPSADVPVSPAAPAPCPEVLPECLNTHLYITPCNSNDETDCICKNIDYAKKVIDCVQAWSPYDDEIQAALSYFAGICAPYVKENPAIVTAVPVTITLCPTLPPSTSSPPPVAPPEVAPPAAGPTPPPAALAPVEPAPPSTIIEVAGSSFTVPQVAFATGDAAGVYLAPGAPEVAPVSPTPAPPVSPGSAEGAAPVPAPAPGPTDVAPPVPVSPVGADNGTATFDGAAGHVSASSLFTMVGSGVVAIAMVLML
ncbi:MAG: hypothetical protein M1833_002146 [Piccolia ochrophora]|nr:MAG: hypothetical protein M1833_002146 [Piccolia ochrophora]